MKISLILILLSFPFCINANQNTEASIPLPSASEKPAIIYDYFPSRMYTFIWRNWSTIRAEKLAAILKTTKQNVINIALSMGLSPQKQIDSVWTSGTGYITTIRRNWHLLPYSQLEQLLGMTEQELSWRLIADDFLYVKLGFTKPPCEPLYYTRPTANMERKAHQIARWLHQLKNYNTPETKRFQFYKELDNDHPVQENRKNKLDIRMIYSYSSEYGDPLLDDHLSSYPENLLKLLSQKGMNALWIHSVLSSLVPADSLFPGSSDYQHRLQNLQRLTDRAAKYGIRIYLYVNEPRSAALSYFNTAEKQSLIGIHEGSQYTFCTSDKRTLQWLRHSFKKIFSSVKGLGGVFTISSSENLTNCASHHHKDQCNRCKHVPYSQIISDVNNAITEGVKDGDSTAQIIVWDWQWEDNYTSQIIQQLNKNCIVMSVSEWGLPIYRGGIKSTIGEYSISSVGPGERALSHWRMARQAGLRTLAKIQVNTTWEIGSIPSVPAMELIARHAHNLSEQQINGIMFSWSLGGYPSDNMNIFQDAFNNKNFSLEEEAKKYYDPSVASHIMKAWHHFSYGFSEFPFSEGVLYYGPQHMGPANPFFLLPTGYNATMVGLPYDDLDGWRCQYPIEVFINQMQKVATGFQHGCQELKIALKKANKKTAKKISIDLARAQAIQLHYQSVINQAQFTYARNIRLKSTGSTIKDKQTSIMLRSIHNELQVVRKILPIVQKDPTIGYESSNQYFYIPQDLLEKYINLKTLQKTLKKESFIFLE